MSRGIRPSAAALCALALVVCACTPPDPKQELELVDFESYWVVDSSRGRGVTYLAPLARIVVRNKREPESHAIQATAVFHIEDPEHTDKVWSAWQPVTGDERLKPGETATVLLESDGRYTSTGPPEAFFNHELFRDVNVEVFLRAGSSQWVKFAAGEVPRRIGSEKVVVGEP